MGTTQRAKNTSTGPDGLPRGLQQTAYIDINYENPVNGATKQPRQDNMGRPYQQQMPQQHMNMGSGYGVAPVPGPGPGMGPYGRSQGQGQGQGPPNMYMNPQRSLSSQSQHHASMYANSPMNSMNNLPMQSQQLPQGTPYQRTMSRKSKRTNSISSVSTAGVNNFMKKQWGRLGGGSKVDVSNADKEDDDEMNLDMNASQTEISYDDLKHIRGGRIGDFGLTDSTPYIPTVQVNMNVDGRGKMTGEQYRKIQMKQKKTAAMNAAKQNKSPQVPSQDFGPQGRSMSLQSFSRGRGGRFAPPNAYPPYMQGMPPQMPMYGQQQPPLPHMQMPMQGQGMGMGQGQGAAPMPPMQMQMQMPMNTPQGPVYPNGMPVQAQYSAYSQMQQAPQGYPSGPVKNQPSYTQGHPLNPRSMSLQSENAMANRQQWQQTTSQQNLATHAEEGGTENVNIDVDASVGVSEITANIEEVKKEKKKKKDKKERKERREKKEKKSKKISKIEFSPVDDDDEKSGEEVIFHDGPADSVLPTIPLESTPAKRAPSDNGRAVVESVVTFDSFDAKAGHQSAMYDLKNNSTHQTVYYSATELPVESPEKSIKGSRSNNALATHAEAEEEPEFTFSSQKSAPKESDNTASGNTSSMTIKESISKPTTQNVNISQISDSLDRMALDISPALDNGTFENNYGSYGDDDAKDENAKRFSTATVQHTEPLHLGKGTDEFKKSEISPAKSILTTESQNLVDMTVDLLENSKSLSPSPLSAFGISKAMDSAGIARSGNTPLSSQSNLFNGSNFLTPSKSRFDLSEGRSPISVAASLPTSNFTVEQCGLVNDNSQLLQELELVTSELALSVSRELQLEDTLRKSTPRSTSGSATIKSNSEKGLTDVTLTEDGSYKFSGLVVKKDGDIEAGSNLPPSQYASVISSLAKLLNEERQKRYLVESMLLEYQQSSSLADVQERLRDEKKNVQELSSKVNALEESVKLLQTEKELLEVEAETLRLEAEQARRRKAQTATADEFRMLDGDI